MLPSTILFVAVAVVADDWRFPGALWGWGAFFGAAVTTTLSTLLIYMSTNTVGPFRTALVMNLEPLLTLIFSMILLGEVLTPVQLVGAAIMIGALVLFQFVRAR